MRVGPGTGRAPGTGGMAGTVGMRGMGETVRVVVAGEQRGHRHGAGQGSGHGQGHGQGQALHIPSSPDVDDTSLLMDVSEDVM